MRLERVVTKGSGSFYLFAIDAWDPGDIIPFH